MKLRNRVGVTSNVMSVCIYERKKGGYALFASHIHEYMKGKRGNRVCVGWGRVCARVSA